MSEAENMAAEISEVLKAMGAKTRVDLGDVLDLNHGIVAALRDQAHNILRIRRAYLEEAERLYEVAITLAETIQVTGNLASELISVEFGGVDPDEFPEEFEDDDE